jgi:lipoprotein-releasing system ATP-binding protein
MSDPAVEVSKVYKSYRMGRTRLDVLRGVSLHVRDGEFLAIVGASGSGKSTLLHLIGLLDKADRGEITLAGRNADDLRGRRRNRARCRDVGFVFQFYHLLPEANVLENTLMPAMVDGPGWTWLARRGELRRRAAELLDELGLSERLRHRPKELSGGERQRVAIARALINEPRLLLADEPTGNLDSKTGRQIMEVLRSFHEKRNQTLIMVTHDASLAEQADRVLTLRDGKMQSSTE